MKRQTKRRNAFWATLGTFAAFALSTASASAQVDGFVWKVDETGATLVSANKNKKSARIPATFNGKSGVAVGFQAFRNCAELESVEFPEGLTTIRIRAFDRCFALKSVAFPASLKTIDDEAVAYCQALKTVEFPKNSALTRIGPGAFIDCRSLEAVALP
ncbi:MAG: leucine-rich repeat domain-containing protein, partial [Thermoguttaceae bacterium]|nr:leucine-rich repeat domain-containing protein [Thermoguttaceae bacterium]